MSSHESLRKFLYEIQNVTHEAANYGLELSSVINVLESHAAKMRSAYELAQHFKQPKAKANAEAA
jgi:hypothetical protein